eukprot:Phypoly_transcript_20904.p1 GENE.Phypoly_transcript_20904~~Phypoly_transcript_20904.p1  ORF type:complete len:133 (-),score=7.63 Phypoly_transcript_20904:183-581(-)
MTNYTLEYYKELSPRKVQICTLPLSKKFHNLALRWHRRNTNGSWYAQACAPYLGDKSPLFMGMLRTHAGAKFPFRNVTHAIFFPFIERALCHLNISFCRNTSLAHGVFALNSNAQDWIVEPGYLTYRVLCFV